MIKATIENTPKNIVKVLKEICLEYRDMIQSLKGSNEPKLLQELLHDRAIYESILDMFEDKEYFNDLAINYLRR